MAPQAQLEESANDRGVHASYALVANQLMGILRPESENPEHGSGILRLDPLRRHHSLKNPLLDVVFLEIAFVTASG